MNKILTRSLITAAVVAGLGLTFEVSAQIPVTDVAANASLITINSQLGTANGTLQSINQQLVRTDQYLQNGTDGNGLLPLLSAINEKMGKINANDGQAGANADLDARKRLYDQGIIDIKKANTPTKEEFLRACVDITSRMTSGQGHGAARGTSDAIRTSREIALDRESYTKDAATTREKLAANAKDRQTMGTCSKQDVENQFPGCDSEGDLPNADVRATSLTLGATNAPSDPTNGSLDSRQANAARAYIRASSPLPPAIPSPDVLETEKGKTYLVMLNRFVARQAAAGDAMGNILASHTAIPLTVQGQGQVSPMMQDWNRKKENWQSIFGPQVAFPAAPSERDMLRYEVFDYYVGTEKREYLGALGKDERGAALASIEVAKQQALTNRLLFQMLQRQEDQNIMLAQLLNQQLEPLTTQNMNSVAAGSNK